jgi:neutral ceramidase
MAGVLHAGVGRATITPPVGIAHAGWGAQIHERAEGVDQDFYVTVLLVRDDDVSCAIVEYDTGTIMAQDAQRICALVSDAAGISPADVLVSYTHTHSGPLIHPLNVRAGMELVAPYWETLYSQTFGAARQAHLAMRPARIGAAYGSSDVAVSRRYPLPDGRIVVSQYADGFTDPTVTVARIDGVDGSPIAAIVGYACHPITLAFQNRLLSPDYPGVVRSVVESLTGATCLFLQGCAGDQMPIEGLTGDTSVHRRLGTRIGAEAAETYLRIDPEGRQWVFDRVVESGAPLGLQRAEPGPEVPADGLRVATGSVTMPIRPLGDAKALRADADAIREELDGLRAGSAPDADIADGMFRLKRAEMRSAWLERFEGRDAVDLDLHGIRIGPFAVVGFPGEPFASIGVDVRAGSPFPVTLMSGYTNGWSGYVPTDDAFAVGGYEVEWGSAFDVGAANALIAGALSLLEELR